MRQLLKASGIGALACSGFLACLFGTFLALPIDDTPVRNGLKDIIGVVLRSLELFVPSSVGQDALGVMFYAGIGAACYGALAGAFFSLSVRGFRHWGHKPNHD